MATPATAPRAPPMKTLQRYIGRDVLFATLLIFGALLALFAFFDLIHELGDVGRGDYTISRALLFVTLHLPSRLYELFPGRRADRHAVRDRAARRQFGIHGDARVGHVARAGRAGRCCASAFRSRSRRSSPANTSRRRPSGSRRRVRTSGDGDTRVVAQQFESGFWFKQDLTFVNIRTVLADMTLVGVRIYEFDDDLRLEGRARRASRERSPATASGSSRTCKSTEIGADATRVTTAPEFMWTTVLRPSILTVYQVAPERLELGTLYDNIRVLGNNAQKTSRFEIAFWNKVFYPLAVLVMMVARAAVRAFPAAPGRRRLPHLRRHDDRARRSSCSAACSRNLGVLNDWPPLFSAVFPLAFFTRSRVAMLWWIERR